MPADLMRRLTALERQGAGELFLIEVKIVDPGFIDREPQTVRLGNQLFHREPGEIGVDLMKRIEGIAWEQARAAGKSVVLMVNDVDARL